MTAVVIDVARAIANIPDPEIPVISLADLGVLRRVDVDDDARTVTVEMTPTYSGCPAMEAMECAVRDVGTAHGYAVSIRTVLSPPWSTQDISAAGRDALLSFGIAPPGPVPDSGAVAVSLAVRQVICPRCGSADTEEIARFGSTACKALRRCRACREPFDEFKPL